MLRDAHVLKFIRIKGHKGAFDRVPFVIYAGIALTVFKNASTTGASDGTFGIATSAAVTFDAPVRRNTD